MNSHMLITKMYKLEGCCGMADEMVIWGSLFLSVHYLHMTTQNSVNGL